MSSGKVIEMADDRRLRVVSEVARNLGKRFWRVQAATDSTGSKIGELYIYGGIYGERWADEDVTPAIIRDELAALGPLDVLHVYINSPGGDPWAAHAIYNLLRRHASEKIVHIDGVAASAASVVAMAGDRVVMPPNSMMMIHKAWTLAIGNADDLREVADVMDRIDESLVMAYEQKTGLERERIRKMLAVETWMTAEEAVELGFADELDQSRAVAASLRGQVLVVNGQEIDLSLFERPPQLGFLPAADPAADAQARADEARAKRRRLMELELELLTG